MSHRALTILAFAASAVIPAQAGYFTSYSIHMLPDTLAVDGIVKFQNTASGGGASWADFLGGGGPTGADYQITEFFQSSESRTAAFFMGMSYDGHQDIEFFDQAALAAIPANEKHLVLFMSNGAAALSIGASFESLFPAYTEAQVIDWLEVVGQIGSAAVGDTIFDQDADNLGTFADYAHTSILDSFSTPVDAWFAIPPDQFASSTSFTGVMFSDGVVVANGAAAQEFVPEPGTFAFVGLAAAGLLALRAR